MPEASLTTLDARITAQSKLLAMIVAELERDGRAERLWRFLESRVSFQDGEEDPGAIPSEAFAFEGAVAAEMRLIAETARRYVRDGE
jgi:hypothetical protein